MVVVVDSIRNVKMSLWSACRNNALVSKYCVGKIQRRWKVHFSHPKPGLKLRE